MTDHVAAMQARLSSAFNKNTGTNLKKLLQTIAAEMDTIDGVSGAIIVSHQWLNASGQSLDNLADTFGVKRLAGQTDSALRTATATVLWQNRSSGCFADIQNLVAFICGVSPANVVLVEPAAAQFRIEVHQNWANSFALTDLYNAINKCRSGGILFLADSTIFLLTEPLVRSIYDSVACQAWMNEWGWGADLWGTDPWGGAEFTMSTCSSVITPI